MSYCRCLLLKTSTGRVFHCDADEFDRRDPTHLDSTDCERHTYPAEGRMVPYNQHSSLAIVSSRRFHFVAVQLLHAIALRELAARTGFGSSILGMEMVKKYGH